MTDHRFDEVIVVVGGRIRAGEDQLVVEDIEALVFHGPEIEGANGDDVEDIEVVFPSEGFFVPLHRTLHGAHGEIDLVLVSMSHVDSELHAAAGHGDEVVFGMRKVACHQSKQVGGLGERVIPFRHVTTAGQGGVSGRIAVRQEDGEARPVGDHAHPVDRHVVGAVERVGDATETLGFALRAEHAVGHVEAGERGVGLRVDLDGGVEAEARHGWLMDDQLV